MNKIINIEIDKKSWKLKKIPTSFSNYRNVVNLSLAESLLDIGLLTRPANVFGIHLSDFWAWLRYLNAFDIGNKLKLNKNWYLLDPHQKTVSSDDFGVGFTAQYLRRYHDFITFSDTLYVLKNSKLFKQKNKAKKGPSKSPDFICLDKNMNIHIVECKGTQSSFNVLKKLVINGISQKNNIISTGNIIDQKLSIGIFVPQYNHSKESTILVVDPEYDDVMYDLSNFSKEELILRIKKINISKELIFSGFNNFGLGILNSIDHDFDLLESYIKDLDILARNDYYNKKNNTFKYKYQKYFSNFSNENKIFSFELNLYLDLNKYNFKENLNNINKFILETLPTLNTEKKTTSATIQMFTNFNEKSNYFEDSVHRRLESGIEVSLFILSDDV